MMKCCPHEEKEEELHNVKTTSSIDVWKKELKELLHLYKSWYKEKSEEFLSNIDDNNKITKVKKNTIIKKKKKNKPKTI